GGEGIGIIPIHAHHGVLVVLAKTRIAVGTQFQINVVAPTIVRHVVRLSHECRVLAARYGKASDREGLADCHPVLWTLRALLQALALWFVLGRSHGEVAGSNNDHLGTISEHVSRL